MPERYFEDLKIIPRGLASGGTRTSSTYIVPRTPLPTTRPTRVGDRRWVSRSVAAGRLHGRTRKSLQVGRPRDSRIQSQGLTFWICFQQLHQCSTAASGQRPIKPFLVSHACQKHKPFPCKSPKLFIAESTLGMLDGSVLDLAVKVISACYRSHRWGEEKVSL